MGIIISTIFLMSVLVLGLASYPSIIPNSENGVDAIDDLQLQLGSIAFAQEENGEEENGEEENGEEENGEEENGEEATLLQIQPAVSGLKVRAEILGTQSEVKVEREFSTASTDIADIITEIITQFELSRDVADAALEIEQADEDEEFEEMFEVEVEVEPEITDVEVELRFVLDTVDRDEILDAIVEKTKLSSQQIEGVLEFEIEEEEVEEEEEAEEEDYEIGVEVKKGKAKIKIELDDEKYRFVLENNPTEDQIIDAIVAKTGLEPSFITDIWEFEYEEELSEEKQTKLAEKIAKKEMKAQQKAEETILKLQQKIEELEQGYKLCWKNLKQENILVQSQNQTPSHILMLYLLMALQPQ